jgi:hypothetical protein
MPKKPWPKSWDTWNKTDEWLSDEIVRIAKENPFESPIWISDNIFDTYGIQIHQSTV